MADRSVAKRTLILLGLNYLQGHRSCNTPPSRTMLGSRNVGSSSFRSRVRWPHTKQSTHVTAKTDKTPHTRTPPLHRAEKSVKVQTIFFFGKQHWVNPGAVASGNRDQINPGIQRWQRLQQTEAARTGAKLLVDHVHEDHVTVHCAREAGPHTRHESSLILPGGPQLGQPARPGPRGHPGQHLL